MRRVAAFAALVACAACAGGQEVSGDLRTVGSVSVTFRVDPARVKIGQAVRVGFRLTNSAGKIEKLSFPSGQRYDFWATRGGRVVWRWSKEKVFVQEITHDSIQSQGTISYAESWTPNRAGTYELHGRLTAQGYAGEMRGALVVR
jgi:intracellular proteinase inhibitor BsuPI